MEHRDLTTALARLKALGVEVPGEDAGRYLALTSDIEGEHKVTVVARGIADAAILELCAVVERQQRFINMLDEAGVQIVSAGGAWRLKDAAALLDSSSVEGASDD
jgi:hypothetical protein